MRASPGPGLLSAVFLLLGAACAPGAPQPGPVAGRSESSPAAPKILMVAIQGEPKTFLTAGPGGGSGGENNVQPMIQDFLAVENDRGVFDPQLAIEQISVEHGTWLVNPDGTMDTIWKLRPNVLWHDGFPFTSDDLLLTFDVYMDPNSSSPGSARPFLLSASAPDPHTFVLRWSTTRFDADRNGIAINTPIPSHIVGEAFARGDRVAFENHPQFFTEFIGLGPYRLTKWERGSHMELARFDAYHQGRPPLDGIAVRFMNDPNAMVASVLSRDVDVVLPVGVDLDAAVDVKRRWEGTGNQVRFDLSSKLAYLELQYRPEVATPKNGFTSATVRQAFYHSIDRQGIAEVATHGLAPIADSWIVPSGALYPELRTDIPPFSYDPQRAEGLLAQAGWLRGPGGVLVETGSGEPFRTELAGSVGEAAAAEKVLSVIANKWQETGAQVDVNLIPAARLSDAEFRALHAGPYFAVLASQRFSTDALHSSQIPAATNRWRGFNRGGYANPRVDAILDQLNTAITAAQRTPLHRQLLREQMGDVAIMPLYWDIAPTLMVKGVTGPIFYRNNASWNIMQWHKEQS